MELYGDSLVAKEEGHMHCNPLGLTEASTNRLCTIPDLCTYSGMLVRSHKQDSEPRAVVSTAVTVLCRKPLEFHLSLFSRVALPYPSASISHLLRALCFLGVRHDGEPASRHPQRSSSCCTLYKSELTGELLGFFSGYLSTKG